MPEQDGPERDDMVFDPDVVLYETNQCHAGARIVRIRAATEAELRELGMFLHQFQVLPIIELDNGTAIALMSDPEGNGPGFPFSINTPI